MRDGQIITAEDMSGAQNTAEEKCEEKNEKKMRELLSKPIVSKAMIKKIKVWRRTVMFFMHPDKVGTGEKEIATTAQTNLNAYWENVRDGQDREAVKKIMQIFKTIFWPTKTERKEGKVFVDPSEYRQRAFNVLGSGVNATMEDLAKNINHDIVTLNAEIKNLERFRRLLEMIGEGYTSSLKVFVDSQIIALDEQIEQIKQEMQNVATKNEAASTQEKLSQSIVPTPQSSEMTQSPEIPNTWEQLGAKFDNIPDEHFDFQYQVRSREDLKSDMESPIYGQQTSPNPTIEEEINTEKLRPYNFLQPKEPLPKDGDIPNQIIRDKTTNPLEKSKIRIYRAGMGAFYINFNNKFYTCVFDCPKLSFVNLDFPYSNYGLDPGPNYLSYGDWLNRVKFQTPESAYLELKKMFLEYGVEF